MNQEQEIKPTVIYSSYTEAQKRATQKYRVANKEKVNERRKAYYQQRKTSDPEFLQYKRTKAREYYQRKKSNAEVKECVSLIDSVCETIKDTNIIESPIIEDVKDVIEPVIEKVDKPKRKSRKTIKIIEPIIVVEEVKPVIEEEVVIEPIMKTKVKRTKSIKVEPTKPNAEVVGIIQDGPILKLQINGEDFCFQHDPAKAKKFEEETKKSEPVKSTRKRVNMSKFDKKQF